MSFVVRIVCVRSIVGDAREAVLCVCFGRVASSSIFLGLSASDAREAGSATCFTGSEYERDGCAIVVLSKSRPLVGVRCNSVSPLSEDHTVPPKI